MPDDLLRTACHGWHAAHGARLVDFAGWEMPIQYSSIIEEHQAVRTAAGLFDIAHMGRIAFEGPGACRLLDRLVTCRVDDLQPGQIRYGLVVNDDGGILDDVLVYQFVDYHLLVVNASNRLKILDWIDLQRGGLNVQIREWTFEKFMLAIQGPHSAGILQPLADFDVSEIPYYWGAEGQVLNVPAIVTRTGYTGEDGYEVIIDAEHGLLLWEALIDRGREHGLKPCGLGCRDTLRLEAAMPLYGHELSESIDPYTAGLSFAVAPKTGAPGAAALASAKARADRKRRVGIELESRRIAREGAAVLVGDANIGQVTSGTFSPTLQKSIAMAYVGAQHAAAGTHVEIDIRGTREPAKVVKLPFYRRSGERGP